MLGMSFQLNFALGTVTHMLYIHHELALSQGGSGRG